MTKFSIGQPDSMEKTRRVSERRMGETAFLYEKRVSIIIFPIKGKGFE